MSLSENSKNTVNLAKLTYAGQNGGTQTGKIASDYELIIKDNEESHDADAFAYTKFIAHARFIAYVAQDGDVLTGKIADKYEIIIADGATVTLSKAKVNAIFCTGDCTIILAENTLNTVKGDRCSWPGIFVPEGKTLTIDGNGSLNVCNEYGVGIGAEDNSSCGNVVIKKGMIKVVGARYRAGIGGGCVTNAKKATYGDVIIYGGSLTVKGGYLAAGIGTGANYNSEVSMGNVTIKGGVVEAKGGLGGAGIGTGPVGCESSDPCNGKSSLKSITISGGSVTAKGAGCAAGIGTGWPDHKDCSTSVESITITDDVVEVTATRGKTPPARCCIGVGGGTFQGVSSVGSITIGGKVTECIEKSSFTYKPEK